MGAVEPTLPAHLGDLLQRARRRTRLVVDHLDDEVVHSQPIDFLSPVVWDVGHIGVFEELWLLRRVDGRPASDPARDELYDAFEKPRWTRGRLPLMPRSEAVAYLDAVRTEVLDALPRLDFSPDHPLLADGAVHRMLVQHESQHLETILQSLQLRDDLPALDPVTLGLTTGVPATWRAVDDTDRIVVPAGPAIIGTDVRGWTYDNERPAHRVEVGAFALDRFPVTARRYVDFIDAGGYRNPRWWTERGWEWATDSGHTHPQNWRRDRTGQWWHRVLGRWVPLRPDTPVQHVSWFEADAYARFAGGRLPTEVEWEKAARWDPGAGRARHFPWGDAPWTPDHANVGVRRLGPAPVGSYPAGASAYGVEQLAGDVYEWTTSAFRGWPGFQAFPYPEYSEVFFDGDYRVLRGSSWAVGVPFARATYRNWDHPYRRQLMAGIRVAYDLPGGA